MPPRGSTCLTTTKTTDAREVLPKGLFTKLRKHCTGLVYVPSPQRDNARRKTVSKLHASGASVTSIARSTGYSAKWVRHIVASADAGNSGSSSQSTSKFLQLVPPDLVEQVQQYTIGRLYIPPRRRRKTGKAKRVEQLLDQGLSVAEVATQAKLSQRQVYRLKKTWSANLWRRQLGEPVQRGQQDVPVHHEPAKPASMWRQCRGCGRHVLAPGQNYCSLCRTVVDRADGDVIVLTNLPFASLDGDF